MRCPKCLKWPTKCTGAALRSEPSLQKQRWRNDVLLPAVDAARAKFKLDVRLLSLFDLVARDFKSHPGSHEVLHLDSPACQNDPERLKIRAAQDRNAGKCAIDCLHLTPKYNHLTVRLLYNMLCFHL